MSTRKPISEETRAKQSAAKLGKARGKNTNTNFELKWGLHARDLAAAECVSVDAIHMRVRNFGTPFQRRSRPTKCETITGRTLGQWAKSLNMHPVSIYLRLTKHGDPRRESPGGQGRSQAHTRRAPIHWSERKTAREMAGECWLHPLHPNYANWMSQFTEFDQYFQEPTQ
jgi:hypothetical protein